MSILARFNAEMKRRMVRLHGAVLMSHGEVIDEVYNPPYTADSRTRMYSSSKSVAAVAIGKLVKEGKLSLDDRIVDIFADRFDMSNAPERLKEQTIRHMLTMTTAYASPTYSTKNKDWLASYFRGTQTHYPDTIWNYDSCGSYVLGAVTKHLTGLDFVEYLRPEFDVMGVNEGVYCLKGPDGEAWASSGFIAATSDLARIAYMLLCGGKWNGQQLIDADFARDAIKPLVRNDDGAEISRFLCGYGYQIWSHPDGGFAFHGLGGQVAIGFPGRDLVFACNADTACNKTTYDDIFNAVEQIILPEFPVTDRAVYEAAQPVPVTRNVFDAIRDRAFRLEPNPMKIEKIRFTGDGDTVQLHYLRGGEETCIEFTVGRESIIVFPEKYNGSPLFDPDHTMNYTCSVIGEWIGERKLRVRVWAEDLYVGNMTMCFAFREDGKISVKMGKNAQFYFDDFSGIACGVMEA